ncbi:MAG TPA: Na(+)-translocating NADH-quinone reductase subunit A [Kiritimatiellia bacterium]|nr:Na(+)-translocating NADH-quinone reductase subunit A [Kiritimatiellia bacterium]HMO98579.1 Na(+)-translocating NADH-quinone reductase subunit A [Kiritimatiellia bacterium]HMP95442.1 Na(+)-translocating NADH-quinone reductase subunit A [Kiritimatiellia bacterium]
MANFRITKGLDIKLAGAPEAFIADAPPTRQVTIYPTEYVGIKLRLKVKEGDSVKRGSPVLYDKKNPSFQVCAPAGGTIAKINFGKRRVLESVVIDVASPEQAESFKKYAPDQLLSIDRATLLEHLQTTGLLALIQSRPFSRMANAGQKPKSIFVNGMNTAPYHPDVNTVLLGHEQAFQAGLNALSRLTDGKVHLCIDGAKQNLPALKEARHVEIHTFTGPHPAGNTSVHIHHVDPISPGDVVWAIKAQDVVLLGQLLINGEYPTQRVISLSGPGLRAGSQRHYRTRLGAPLAGIIDGNLNNGEMRILSGDVLSGAAIPPDSSLKLLDHAITILPEDRERHFMGWLAPGHNRLSVSRTFVSKWFGLDRKKDWSLGTNQRGELRPMVLTGLYDRFVPMNIMTDYLVRAVLAKDADEAIALGLLETDPEDFALCAFACPSKMDLVGIIRKGLDQVEKEGI